MDGEFHVYRGTCATAQESFEATPAIEANRPPRPWQFVDEFQRLVGVDSEPDASFFVEIWTSGASAAVENFQQRRLKQTVRERPRHSFRELENLDTASFVQERELCAEFASSVYAPGFAGCYGAGFPPPSAEEHVAQAHEQTPQECDTFAEECVGNPETARPMTLERARLLLGVSATSTQRQIKAAYRRMVSQWHPDRLELRTEAAQKLATERMAAINEAYHQLRDGRLQQSV